MASRQFRYPDAALAAEACGRHILDLLDAAIAGTRPATLAVSGGSSPRPMFEIFARTRFPWDRVQLFWVDERAVPPTDPQSNFKLADDIWLTRAHFPQRNIHRIETELPPEIAARRYADEIRRCLELDDHAMPRFDVIHRGMGPDGHTASLFPGEPLLEDRGVIAAALWVEKLKMWRVTLLPGVLMAARHTAMLVTGADKAEALRATLYGDYDPKLYPAQLATRNATRSEGSATWFLDEAAAARL